MEKKVIDGVMKLKPNQIAEFCKEVNDDEDIVVYFTNKRVQDEPRALNCKKQYLIETAFSYDVSLYCDNDEDEIRFECEKATLVMAAADIRWWMANNRRLNQFREAVFNNNNEDAQTRVIKSSYDKNAKYSVAIADMTMEGLTHIDYYQGTKAECLKWLNNMIVRHTDLSEQTMMVFNLNFKEEDLQDIDKWKTLDELLEEKKISM